MSPIAPADGAERPDHRGRGRRSARLDPAPLFIARRSPPRADPVQAERATDAGPTPTVRDVSAIAAIGGLFVARAAGTPR
jgi:hypothetical protein